MIVKFVPLREYHWPWIAAQAQPELTPRTRGIVALDENGTILAATVFDTWTYTSGQAHFAISNPLVLRHGFFEECLDYFFNYCDKRVLIGLVPSNNAKSLRLTKHIGFTEVFRMKDGYDHGIDYVVFEMRKENCRWIHGKESARRA